MNSIKRLEHDLKKLYKDGSELLYDDLMKSSAVNDLLNKLNLDEDNELDESIMYEYDSVLEMFNAFMSQLAEVIENYELSKELDD